MEEDEEENNTEDEFKDEVAADMVDINDEDKENEHNYEIMQR